MTRIPNIHPGEILKKDFLMPLGISAYRLAKETGLSATRVGQIIQGKRSITADTALRFSAFFETSPEFWLGLQQEYELREEQYRNKKILSSISPYTMFAMQA